jgi:hypothetical protein
MRYWLTTHYPHYDEARYSFDIWSVFVRRGFEDTIRQLKRGDGVAIYLGKHGPRIKGAPARPRGPQAIACICTVAEDATPFNLFEQYTNGTTGDYAWRVACTAHEHGMLPRPRLCELLGWKTTFTLRGIGRGSGIIELSPEHFAHIERQFRRR